MGKNIARLFAQAAVLLLGLGMAWGQTTVTFPGGTLSGNFGAWGGTGHFYAPTFNVNAPGGIDITYFGIDVSKFTEANIGTTKGVALPGVSASNTMTSIDPNNNSVWCNILNMEVESGTDWDGHAISTLGSDGTSGNTRHQGTQDWYRPSAGGKIDGPADGPYYNNESYVIPNLRHPDATPMTPSELNSYDFRLRILPTVSNGTYTYEMWIRMHNSAARIEGASWNYYNLAINAVTDPEMAWRKFAQGATDQFQISGLNLSSVYVFMGLGNFQDPATQDLTWGKIEVKGTLTALPSDVFVNPAYTAGGTNDGHVWGYDAFATIQPAIDAIAKDGTVHVSAGAYHEVLTISQPLTLKGAQAGVDACERSGSESIVYAQAGGSTAISIKADNVTIDGMMVEGTGIAKLAAWGINAAAGVQTSGVHITNTIFKNLYEGLHVQGPATNVSSNMTVDHNKFFDASDDVLKKDAGIWMASAPSSKLTIKNNCFSGHDAGDGGDYAAINIDYSTDLEIKDNTSFNDGSFLVLVNNTNVTVTGNSSSNTDAEGFTDNSTIFIAKGNNGVTIQDNTLSLGFRGVRFSDAFGTGVNQNIQILNNTITNMKDFGILVPKGTVSDAVIVHFNNISGNAIGVQNDAANVEIDATCNWWGDASGPSGVGPGTGDKVSENVAFYPWWGSFPASVCGVAKVEKGMAKDALATYLNSSDKKVKDAAKKATELIDQSLASELWANFNHLTAKGRKVFDKEKEAAAYLMEKILKHYTGTVYNDALASIGHLVNADRILAQIAINEADCNGDPQCVHELEKANEEMSKAVADNAAGRYDVAIDDYRKAWEHAMKAAKNALMPNDAEGMADAAAVSLGQNYPNPFNPMTAIGFYVPQASPVSLIVYNTLGQRVAELVNGTMEAGYHQVTFDATNLSSGIYFYRMTAGQFTEIRRMMFLK